MQIDALTIHASVWRIVQQVLNKNRLPHALLLAGPRHAGILQFANRLMALRVCLSAESAPCGICQPCHLLLHASHPDIQYVTQETPTSPIKIDQVRELQESVYRTPQCGECRFVIIEPADRLNQAAANALLKILEEPPSHTTFILIAEQMSRLPATIMSRCQQYTFSPPELFESIKQIDYLTIGKFYPEGSVRAELFKQCLLIIDDLCGLLDRRISASILASKWSSYALGDLLWFLYLFIAQAIRYQMLSSHATQPWSDKLHYFTRQIEPAALFQLLDQINSLMGIVQQNITLNQTLAIETLLMNLIE